MRPRPNQLEITAYHEAGHVVMGYLEGVPSLQRVWITEGGNGMMEAPDDWPRTLTMLEQGGISKNQMEPVWRRLEWTIKTLLAGPIAEYRFLRKKITGPLVYQNISVRENGEADLQKVWRIIRGLNPARRGETQGTDTGNELHQNLHEFHQYLLQEEVKKIFRKPKVWPTVTTLASALIKHKELDGDTAWEICEKCGLTYGREVST